VLKAFAIAVSLLALPALAAEIPVHTVDMSAVLNGPDGVPLKDGANNTELARDEKGAPKPVEGGYLKADPECAKCPVLTLGRAVANALMAPDRDAPDQMWPRGELAARIRPLGKDGERHDDPAATPSAKETEVMIKLLKKTYPSPVVLMQAIPRLDPNAKAPDLQ
jgi:hypothetical protein